MIRLLMRAGTVPVEVAQAGFRAVLHTHLRHSSRVALSSMKMKLAWRVVMGLVMAARFVAVCSPERCLTPATSGFATKGHERSLCKSELLFVALSCLSAHGGELCSSASKAGA